MQRWRAPQSDGGVVAEQPTARRAREPIRELLGVPDLAQLVIPDLRAPDVVLLKVVALDNLPGERVADHQNLILQPTLKL